MTQTEAVQRVVLEARKHARADSHIDEREWFEAGEDDTAVDVPLQDITQTTFVGAVRPAWEPYAVAVGAILIVVFGIIIGMSLA